MDFPKLNTIHILSEDLIFFMATFATAISVFPF